MYQISSTSINEVIVPTDFGKAPYEWDADLHDSVLHNCTILLQKLIYPLNNLSKVSSLQFAKSFLLFVFIFSHGEKIVLGFMQCYPLLQLPIYQLDRYLGSQELKILPSKCY